MKITCIKEGNIFLDNINFFEPPCINEQLNMIKYIIGINTSILNIDE